MAMEVIMPQLGEGVIEGTIAGWLKKEGDAVEQYEPILEIETDKVTTEATAEIAGTLLKILVAEGETVPVGAVLAVIGESGEEVGEMAEIAPVKAAPNSEACGCPSGQRWTRAASRAALHRSRQSGRRPHRRGT